MSLTQTINKNRKSMNKEYFVLEIEDTSSAEYRKNYWKKAAEILLERIYQREQCISEKVKNIIELCSLPEHRFFNVDVYMPKKRNKADTNYYTLHYDFTYIQNDILGMIDYLKMIEQ